jgi:DNA-binding transcriptional ArsR family regulator
VRFAPSAAQEALLSLYVLYLPKRFPLHTQWVLSTRRRLSHALKAEFDFFEPMWGNSAVPLIWDPRFFAKEETFEEQLQGYRTRPLETYINDMMVGFELEAADLQRQPQLLERPYFRLLHDDPAAHRERFLAMFQRYWQEAFAAEWLEIETLIAQDIERRSRVMFQKSVLHGLVNLSRYLLANFETHTATVTYNTLNEDVLFPPERHLYLMPSYFTWPFLFLSVTSGDPLITYPLMHQQAEGDTPVPPERLLQLLKAAGDATRLQILQLLAVEPRSTRQLAGLIRISEATVSKHLKQLQEANLITPQRDSHYVFYHLVKNGLRELTHGIAQTFELDSLMSE